MNVEGIRCSSKKRDLLTQRVANPCSDQTIRAKIDKLIGWVLISIEVRPDKRQANAIGQSAKLAVEGDRTAVLGAS